MTRSKPDGPVLILLNGAPASGKSTLARRWGDTDAALEVVDIDTIRSGLDLWPAEPERAGLAARRLAVGHIARSLGAGRHVVVPQFLSRHHFIEELGDAAAKQSAAFVECVLDEPRARAVAAFLARSTTPTTIEHVHADVLVDGERRAEQLGEMHDALQRLVRDRPGTRRIDVARGDVAGTLRRLRAVVPEV